MAARIVARGLVVAVGILGAPLAAFAQADRAVRIVLQPAPDGSVFRQMFEPFRQSLRERGFVEGTNLTIERRVQPGRAEEMPQGLELAAGARQSGHRVIAGRRRLPTRCRL